MNREQQLRDKVMRRVWGVFFFRFLMRPETHIAGLAVTAFVLSISVSMKDIFANAWSALGSPTGFFYYLLDALVTTEFVVQLFTFVGLALVLLAVRDFCMLCLTFNPFTATRQIK